MGGGGGHTIYYTLDSSKPTSNSFVYTEPILIADASSNKNIYSSIPDVYLGFSKELETIGLIDPANDIRKIPQEAVDKATVVRAAVIDENGTTIAEHEGIYFVGFDNKNGYDEVGVISIVTDPDNLFGYENGIYVSGIEFDNYFTSLDSVNDFSVGYAGANYKRRGIGSRRRATITWFGQDKKFIGCGSYDIAIQGGMTRSDIPRSLNIYETDEGKIEGRMLGFQYDIDALTLFSGGNDRTTKLCDPIINDCVSNLDYCSREYIPYVMFLEGEYWGVYFITEKFDDIFFQNKYGVDHNDTVMLKGKTVEIGDKSDREDWLSIRQFIVENDMQDKNSYNYVCSVVDINSCIDYYATEIYIANTDWPGNNYAVWRSKLTSGRTIYDDGKWRWVLFDVNSAVNLDNVELDGIDRTIKSDEVFMSLMENVEFEHQIKRKLIDLSQNTFEPEKMREKIAVYHDMLLFDMDKDYERFFGDRSIYDYTEACEDMVTFFEQRADYILFAYGDD